jgi:hypothetical protein
MVIRDRRISRCHAACGAGIDILIVPDPRFKPPRRTRSSMPHRGLVTRANRTSRLGGVIQRWQDL